jgi:hypothetical protein
LLTAAAAVTTTSAATTAATATAAATTAATSAAAAAAAAAGAVDCSYCNLLPLLLPFCLYCCHSGRSIHILIAVCVRRPKTEA